MLTINDPRHAHPDARVASVKPISPPQSRSEDLPAETRLLLKFPHVPNDVRKALESRQNSSGE